jgi:hypothetical protein
VGSVDKKLETTAPKIGVLIRSFGRMRLRLKKAFAMLPRRPDSAPPGDQRTG